ncbi:mechanosensitive ion channel family protein [Ramlibacter pallidus]|uniref:Mechanosensitive ion channel family protein n=1 Tax=Ramlibacter pallidus TaxID=2780087 RepID=A0ABR9S4Z4_9BURK|nr:mechanosensitive ion channel domain-containing protein [Ramlibacter pallidus]MBE7368593.1 mechanosensitive ion channel family protein [Ramlibacter pallidus]
MLPLLQGHPWMAALLAALAAALVALALHHAARAVLRRVLVREHAQVLSAMLERTQRAAGFAAPLLAMQLVWAAAPDTLDSIGAVRHVNGVLLIIALTAFLMGLIGGIADGLIARHPSNVEDNLHARRVETQTRVLSRSAQTLVLIGGAAMVLMTFPGMRQLGASLLASAGLLGIIAGLAARPVFSNLISGLQIALSQPIRIDDVLIVQGEWGRVEEITGTYVVLKIWDERRLIIPLQWFIENPFENWTRTGSNLLGTVFLYLDYTAPLDAIRAEAKRIVEAAPEWDGRVFNVQVTDASERAMQVRVLVSANNSGKAFDLRCKVREGVLAFLAREHPQSLPVVRAPAPAAAAEPA